MRIQKANVAAFDSSFEIKSYKNWPMTHLWTRSDLMSADNVAKVKDHQKRDLECKVLFDFDFVFCWKVVGKSFAGKGWQVKLERVKLVTICTTLLLTTIMKNRNHNWKLFNLSDSIDICVLNKNEVSCWSVDDQKCTEQTLRVIIAQIPAGHSQFPLVGPHHDSTVSCLGSIVPNLVLIRKHFEHEYGWVCCGRHRRDLPFPSFQHAPLWIIL